MLLQPLLLGRNKGREWESTCIIRSDLYGKQGRKLFSEGGKENQRAWKQLLCTVGNYDNSASLQLRKINLTVTSVFWGILTRFCCDRDLPESVWSRDASFFLSLALVEKSLESFKDRVQSWRGYPFGEGDTEREKIWNSRLSSLLKPSSHLSISLW